MAWNIELMDKHTKWGNQLIDILVTSEGSMFAVNLKNLSMYDPSTEKKGKKKKKLWIVMNVIPIP